MSSQELSSVMFIGAHPDDETVMVGGTLAMLNERGVETHVVCATDGRGGEYGDVAEANTPEALAHMRAAEMACAAEALGIADLTMLGYEDPVIEADEELHGFAEDDAVLVARLADLIRQAQVQVVLTHGSDGEYGHPAHRQVHRAVLQAVREHVAGVVCYSIAAQVPNVEDRLWNQSDPAHLALSIQQWIEAKHAAMLCHRTQHALFMRRRRLKAVREAIRSIESFHRHWPELPSYTVPDDPFAALLLRVGAWHPDPSA
jgi:N-acetylglucosamine malate deacetylase 2